MVVTVTMKRIRPTGRIEQTSFEMKSVDNQKLKLDTILSLKQISIINSIEFGIGKILLSEIQ